MRLLASLLCGVSLYWRPADEAIVSAADELYPAWPELNLSYAHAPDLRPWSVSLQYAYICMCIVCVCARAYMHTFRIILLIPFREKLVKVLIVLPKIFGVGAD
jgi:hypothetical protein